ncbi:hypothetical protein KR215_005938, partial [Drosophila sulfurigaster]
IYARFEFTNLECDAIDKAFGIFDYCYLKSVNRTYKYASAKYLPLQVPINNIIFKIELMKRLNGYKPFLYNISFDYCRYMRNPNSGNKVETFFLSLVQPYTNVNHTCPYSEDLLVDKLPISFLDYKLTKILPLPEGDYRVRGIAVVNGIKRAHVNTYFRI